MAWDGNQLACGVDAGERASGGAEQYTAVFEFVNMVDAGACGAVDARGQREQVIVVGGFSEFDLKPRDGEKLAGFFHVGVIVTLLAQKLCSALLEINQVLRVVQIAHRVALGIANPNLRVTFGWCRHTSL